MRAGRQARGYDAAWYRLRARHLRANPRCIICGVRAEHVDHVQPIRQAPHRRLDPFNLQSLCEHHHNQATQAFDAGRIKGACDDQGQTLDPSHPWARDDAKWPGTPRSAELRAQQIEIAQRMKRKWMRGKMK